MFFFCFKYLLLLVLLSFKEFTFEKKRSKIDVDLLVKSKKASKKYDSDVDFLVTKRIFFCLYILFLLCIFCVAVGKKNKLFPILFTHYTEICENTDFLVFVSFLILFLNKVLYKHWK